MFSQKLVHIDEKKEVKTVSPLNSRIVIPQAPNIKIDALKGKTPDHAPAWFNFYDNYYYWTEPFGNDVY